MSCEDWTTTKLSDICTKVGSGVTPRGGSSAYIQSGVALIRSQNVLDFQFSDEGLVYIRNEQAEKMRGVTVCRDDILLNITGDSVARACMVPLTILPSRVNQHVSIIRVDKNIANSYFLFYFLQNQKPLLLSLAGTGGTRNALTKSMILDLDIKLPPLVEQKAIARILSSLDDKIELNNRMNKTLEEIAQTLFKRWFVDFEFPDENGDPYKSSGGKMVQSELGLIPEGWSVCKLYKITTRLIQKNSPFVSDNTITISAKDGIVNDYFKKKVTSKDLSKYIVIKKGDFGYSRSSSVGYSVGAIRRMTEYDVAVVSPIYLCFRGVTNNYAVYLDQYFKIKLFEDELSKIVHMGSRGHGMLNYQVNDFFDLPVINPINIVLQQYVDKVEWLSKYNELKKNETRMLSQLRDTLLPKLMSGEVRVPITEE